MNENTLTEPTLRAVLQGSDWQAADVKVERDPTLKSSSRCSLYVARNTRIPGAGMLRFALAGDGKLMARTGDLTGLAQLLRQCVTEDAQQWAQAVACYVDALAPQVIGASDVRDTAKLSAAGLADVAPSLQQLNGATELRFVMKRPVARYFHVKAVLPAHGPVSVDVQPVALR